MHHYRADLDPARFGQQRFEFRVPEFAAGSEARAVLDLDGRNFTRVEKLTPKRKFTVYMVPHTHLDIGFTDYQPKIEELQNRNLDRLLEEMRHDPDMRFSLDGAWLAEQYLRTRSPAARTEFLDAVRAGRISIPAQYANLMARRRQSGNADPLDLRRPRAQSRRWPARPTTPTSPTCRLIRGATPPCWPLPA